MADFTKNLKFEISMHEVDPGTWADSHELGNVNSVAITRSKDALIEGATITADVQTGNRFREGYYRIVMRTMQDGATERHEVATVYCTSSSGTITDDETSIISIDGKSVLYPANEVTIGIGAFVPRGADGAEYVVRTLQGVLAAPVVAEGSFALADDYVFDIGEKVLSAVWKVLDAANWCMQIAGDGTVTVREIPSRPQTSIDARDVIAGNLGYSNDFEAIPNRYVAFDGTTVASYRNDDSQSEVSIPRKGFVKDISSGIDTSPVLIGGESLEAYCRRKLIEASVSVYQQSYTREYDDELRPYSMVLMRAHDTGEYEEFSISTQSVTISDSLAVGETSERRVQLWQG